MANRKGKHFFGVKNIFSPGIRIFSWSCGHISFVQKDSCNRSKVQGSKVHGSKVQGSKVQGSKVQEIIVNNQRLIINN
jgi:hypothetical protein